MSSRYTCVSVYGLVGLAWVFIFVPAGAQPAKVKLLIAPLVLIFAVILLTISVEWGGQCFSCVGGDGK
jgi:hypothetical protein